MTKPIKRAPTAKHISLDRENEQIQHFIRSLPVHPDGSVLELGGEPMVRVLPIDNETVDQRKLVEAIRKGRDESRRLNTEWEHVDRESWESIPDDEP